MAERRRKSVPLVADRKTSGPAQDPTARAFVPSRKSLTSLRDAARGCRGCPLYSAATQTVFGEGPVSARVMLVGEQPGNDEDLSGRPFVGPAGRVLDKALGLAGMKREEVYVTNVVKHFYWVLRGKRRLHKKPVRRYVDACEPWLDEEAKLIEPEVLVCMGATAAQAILGPSARVSEDTQRVTATKWCEKTIATIHPSSILRQQSSEERAQALERLVRDLRLAAKLSSR
jgi:uracil-DNA glycosylase family protein